MSIQSMFLYNFDTTVVEIAICDVISYVRMHVAMMSLFV